ncbi:hypothetical protein V6Z11_D05G285200 [Gossypium hirsutum]
MVWWSKSSRSQCLLSHSKDCIGATDGTYVVAILPPNEQIPYIERKCGPTQN